LNTIGDHPAEAQKIRKAWEIDRFSGYPWLSPIKNWKIMENRKRKKPSKNHGNFVCQQFFPVDFPFKTIGKSWNLHIFPAKPIQKKTLRRAESPPHPPLPRNAHAAGAASAPRV
jgi:hypothetical protein